MIGLLFCAGVAGVAVGLLVERKRAARASDRQQIGSYGESLNGTHTSSTAAAAARSPRRS